MMNEEEKKMIAIVTDVNVANLDGFYFFFFFQEKKFCLHVLLHEKCQL